MNNGIRKIVMVIPTLHKGGAEKVLVHFVNNLDYKKYQPIIFCLKKEGDFLSSINPEVTVVDLKSPRAYFSIFKIRKQLQIYQPDVLIGWMGHINALLAFSRPLFPRGITFMSRESNIPSKFLSYYRIPGLFKFMYGFLNRYDGIICQTNAMKMDLVENFKVDQGKIRTIPNPVVINSENISLPDDAVSFMNDAEKILLFVGRFSPEKRPELLLEVMLSLPVSYKMVLIGYGPLEKSLDEQISEKGIANRVKIITNCSNPVAFYKRADCFLLTSSLEGMPNVLLESYLCGCPVVVYQTEGGVQEIVKEGNGIYLSADPANDIGELARVIKEVCNSPDKYNRTTIMEKANAEYGVQKIIKQYADYIEWAIETKATTNNK